MTAERSLRGTLTSEEKDTSENLTDFFEVKGFFVLITQTVDALVELAEEGRSWPR